MEEEACIFQVSSSFLSLEGGGNAANSDWSSFREELHPVLWAIVVVLLSLLSSNIMRIIEVNVNRQEGMFK